MNIFNVEDIEQQLKIVAARAHRPQVRDWVMTVARKALLNMDETDGEARQEFEPMSLRRTGRERFTTLPRPEELPDWARNSLQENKPVHFFRSLQPRIRSLWQDIDSIVDWFNYNLSDEDPVLNRLSRVSFQDARQRAVAWRKKINDDPWGFVRDKPPVVHEFKNGFKWVQLVTLMHARREASLMHHCVDQHGYIERSNVYSLRDKDNRPHITMEVDRENSRTLQIKGNTNRKPEARYQPYIRPFLKAMKIKLEGDSMHVD